MSQAGRFLAGTGAAPIETITGNAGGPVPPDAGGNINLVGDGIVTTNGNPGTNTLTIYVDGSVPTQFDADSGTAIPIGHILDVVGTLGITTAGAGGTLTIKTDGTIATSYGTDAGTATPLAGVLDIIGGAGISTSGAGNTITITSSGMGVETLVGNVGTATGATINVLGVNNITTTGDNVATLRINLTGTTDHALQLGNAGGSLTSLGVATNGQLPIGSTGADPVLAALTAGTNVSITNGAGSITIAANSTSFTANYTAVNFGMSPYAASATDYYLGVDATGGAVTVRLPNAPATGRVFIVKDNAGIAGTNNITVTTVGGVVNLDGATSFVMNTNYEAAQFIFNGASYEVF